MGNRKSEELNEKQERFCMEYMIDLNASQAALRSGYKNKGAATYLMSLPKVKERIDQLKKFITASELVTVEYILNGLTEVVDRCLAKEPLMEWDNEKHCRMPVRDENDKLVWTFNAMGANKALELLGRYAGLFSQDNQQRINPVNNKAELTDEQFTKLLDAATKGTEISY